MGRPLFLTAGGIVAAGILLSPTDNAIADESKPLTVTREVVVVEQAGHASRQGNTTPVFGTQQSFSQPFAASPPGTAARSRLFIGDTARDRAMLSGTWIPEGTRKLASPYR